MITSGYIAPWSYDLSPAQYLLTLYFLVVAALAFFAGFIRSFVTRNEVGSRFRSVVVARLGITALTTVTYAILVLAFLGSYRLQGNMYLANSNAVMTMAPRFMEWSVCVPLLTLELLAVTTLTGEIARRAQYRAVGGSFLMIFSGFLGLFVFGPHSPLVVTLVFGLASVGLWMAVNVVLIRAVRQSLGSLTPESAALLSRATRVLLTGWVVYPIVYLVEVLFQGSGWVTAVQVALCAADVTVKLGFGTMIHRVAKLRTAEDVRAGDDIHPEAIWISSIKQSDAGMAREVFLAAGSEIHPQRARPPITTAVAAPPIAEEMVLPVVLPEFDNDDTSESENDKTH
jgi:bacteriorhodopsin